MENSYEQLIDDYNNGILVEAGESLTDYISRMGGVNYPDKKANGGIITALRIGLANGSLSPDELAALKEEVKQNPTMVNEITDIEFGVNEPGPATDQGPYIRFDKKKEEEDMQKELEGEMKDMTKDFGLEEKNKRVQAAIKLAAEKNIGIGDALMITDNDRYNIDTGVYIGPSKRIKALLGMREEDANGGVAGILGL